MNQTYNIGTDPATLRFIAEANRHAAEHKAERRMIATAAAFRRWPHIPQAIIRLAISLLDAGRDRPVALPPIAIIRWNYGNGSNAWLRSVDVALSRIAAAQ
jgi:hypothetical protein